MKYEGMIYRPPSEAHSLIVQVTIGCSHNMCTFCSMYKDKQFRVRNVDEIIKELEAYHAKYGANISKVFLADGNALVLKNSDLEIIFKKINELFDNPNISIYATPLDILRKSERNLAKLSQLGLHIIYMGIESGSDIILSNINKGVDSAQMIEAGKKIEKTSIKLSVMIISGLGGSNLIEEHAIQSAKVVSQINPDYLSLLTLMIDKFTKLSKDIDEHKFKLLTPEEIMRETLIFIQNLELNNCMFRSNHASNYVALSGTFPDDKTRLIESIEFALENSVFKDERWRRL